MTVDPRFDAQYALEEGIFAYQHAIDHGIESGIGTDLETTYGGDMFTEMRVTFSLQRASAQNRRHRGEADAPSPASVREILAAATINGARCAGFENRTGSLTPGKEADIILLRTNDLNLFPAHNAIGTVVHAADRGNVDTVLVGGIIRKRSGKLVDVNVTDLREAAIKSATHIFSSAGYNANPFKELSPVLSNSHST